MKVFKKLLSALLVVMMLLGVVSVTASAGWWPSKAYISESGSCGSGVYYTFDKTTGELIISGTGEIETESFFCLGEIKIVIIEKGITEINSRVFYGCTKLTRVSIPESVTNIAYEAFYNCRSLTEITIPNSVTSIGDGAFRGCTALTNLTIPDSVTSIVKYAFFGCTGLTSVTIGSGVSNIGNYVFSGCTNLTSINVDKDNTVYDSRNNCNAIIETETNTLVQGCKNTVIPDSVISIGEYAFYGCVGLTSIIIPDSVTSIDNGAFKDCTGLTNITIPDNVTYICKDFWYVGAFDNTGYYNDESNWENGVLYIGNHLIKAKETISGAYEIKKGTKDILGSAFEDCAALTSITIPDSVTNIGDGAFGGCTGLSEIIIPDSVTSIGGSAFRGCSSLKSIDIPDSVTSIGGYAFHYTGYYNDESNWENGILYIGKNLITAKDTISGAYTIKNGTKEIANRAFQFCEDLTSITIPDSVVKFHDEAFYCCYGLKSVNYTGTIDKWCEIEFSDSTANPTCYSNCLSINGNSIKEVTIPNGVTAIKNYTFFNCTGLTEITISNSVTSIGNSAFKGCTGWTSIHVDEGNTVYDSRNNCNAIIETKTNTLVLGCKNTVIPNGVTSIGDYAFYDCADLKNIVIPDSVRNIGDYAFCDCINLTNVIIPDDVTNIGSYAFCRCIELTDIKIPDSVITMGRDVFDFCTGLNNVVIGNGVKNIAICAFYDCYRLTSVKIPNSVTSIDGSAFAYCSGLTSITIPDNVTSIGSHAFEYCSGLTSITIPDSVTSIDSCAFYNCTNLTNVTIGSGVTNIGSLAFSGCTNLTNINIDKDNTVYDSRNNCNAIIETKTNTLVKGFKSMVIPNSVTSIGYGAFYGCTGLTSITIPDSVTSIGNEAFENCTGLTSITIPDSVTSINSYAFNGCTGLTNITIPDSVTIFGYQTFNNTKYYNDESNWENDVLYIGNHLIKAKDTLSGAYEIKDGTKTIADEAFYCCVNLTNVTIPDSITSINGSAFYGCALTEITIPQNVSYISNSAFSSCSKLISINVDTDNKFYTSDEYGVLYNKDKTELLCYPKGLSQKSYSIPVGVIRIGDAAFSGSLLSYLSIPKSVETIDWSAFGLSWHYSLTDIYYSGSKAEWDNIFISFYNDGLEEVTIHYNSTDSSNTLIDETSGIKIEYNTELDEGTEIIADEIFDGESLQLISSAYGEVKTKLFNISLQKDGEKVQPSGDVTVKIPVPAGFDPNKIFVTYVDSNNGKVTKIDCEVKDGYVIFKTDHFSEYAIIESQGGVDSVSLSNVTMDYKSSKTLNPEIVAADGAKYTITYSSDSKNVTVDENGKIYAAKRGTANITVTVTDSQGNTVTDTCKVEVKYTWWQWIIKIVLFGWIWY